MEYDNLILYDYFSFTTKYHGIEYITHLLGVDLMFFQSRKGARGYQEALTCGGIHLFYGGRDEIWCEMTGQGCRTFETHGHGAWDTLFEETLTDRYHITRLDVAFDDHTGILDLDIMAQDTENKKNLVSEFRSWEICTSDKGITIYLGSKSSDTMFRIYDKAKERGKEDEGHWVRFEIQLRDDHARNFLGLLTLRTIGETFVGVISRQARYVRQDGKDTNMRRWPMAGYWKKFIGTAEKLSVYQTPGSEYNLGNLEYFAIQQAGAASAALIKIIGAERFQELVDERLSSSSNPKYESLIQQYKLEAD